jgi:hypothetical protein
MQAPRHEDVWDRESIHPRQYMQMSGQSHAKAALSPGRLYCWVGPRASLKGVENIALLQGKKPQVPTG